MADGVPTPLEAEAILHALSGDEVWKEALKAQVPHLLAVAREISPVGSFTHFRFADSCPPARIPLDDGGWPPRALFNHPAMQHGGGFILWTKDGWVDYLECYINGEEILPDLQGPVEEFTFYTTR